jgi:photosynthetic reaction center H subunit
MQPGAITNYIDVAQLALYAFWLFFAGLVFYLHREDKREGYPLVSSDGKGTKIEGFPFIMPKPKAFIMPDGSRIVVPRAEEPEPLNAVPIANFPGAPYEPLGNPMLAGMGPGAWARRADHPDLAWDDSLPKIVPLRVAPAFFLATEDPDVTGFDVVGLDGEIAGRVVDAWIDRSEVVIRYYEVELADMNRVLIPLNFLSMNVAQRRITTRFITGAQFATVPALKNPEQVTLLEEDKIVAYYGGGMLYARPGRGDPLL